MSDNAMDVACSAEIVFQEDSGYLWNRMTFFLHVTGDSVPSHASACKLSGDRICSRENAAAGSDGRRTLEAGAFREASFGFAEDPQQDDTQIVENHRHY